MDNKRLNKLMNNQKLSKGIIGFLIISMLSIVGYVYINDYIVTKQEDARWESVVGRTYDSNSPEEIYITSRENDILKLQNENLNILYDNTSLILNSKKNYYKTRSNTGPFFGIFSEYRQKYKYVYLVKKDNQQISVIKLEQQYIYDQRDEYNSQFTVTIKKPDNQYRVYLKNKKIDYDSTNLP